MKSRQPLSFVSLFLFCGSLIAASPGAADRENAGPRSSEGAKGASPPAPAAEVEPRGRVVSYGEKDVVTLNTKVRYTTLIVLPKNEQILDFTCGDRDYWVVNGNQNFAHVKPARAAAQTNLNLITASGNIYSFVLMEVSERPGAMPDLKIFIEPKEESMIAPAGAAPRFVSAQVAEDYRRQVEIAKDETRLAKESAQAAVDSGISKFMANVRFPYRFEAGKKPFFVRAIYHDDRFTYIQARPEETPTLCEIQDGKPNLVNFEYKNGVYVVEKILERGYLAIGKQKLSFRREE